MKEYLKPKTNSKDDFKRGVGITIDIFFKDRKRVRTAKTSTARAYMNL
ncbi:MAG: hypothetical protein IKZ52_01840 [Bacteroidales bacterium]|nr:hypothetical protein [Bacteroidales bacterium]